MFAGRVSVLRINPIPSAFLLTFSMSILWQTISAFFGDRPREAKATLPDFQRAGPTLALTIADGVQVVVPNSLDLLTPYVLIEQQDWFEDEIKFLRRLLEPGQKVIDIGANYGVYTLSMAKTVGPAGQVWAFEPASSTARLLAAGIAINQFSQVILDHRALSRASGTAQLSLHQQSEFNSLVRSPVSTSATETVELTTLDQCREHYGWQDIAFLKIDAEGEEANILEGGTRFFSELSPLVQYEVNDAAKLHLDLVQTFARLGYDSYRLVPGLDLLVPFDGESEPDGYLLNLFCCKKDRAEQLAARGYLCNPRGGLSDSNGKNAERGAAGVHSNEAYRWPHTLAKLPYGTQLASVWDKTMANGSAPELEQALAHFAISRDLTLTPSERFNALEASIGLLKELTNKQASHLRLATLARVAREFGDRGLAVNALQFLLNDALSRSDAAYLNEPFLAPAARFDTLEPGNAINDWLLTAVLEAFEELGSFSSFHSKSTAQGRLETILARGFGSANMQRRLDLLLEHLRLFPQKPSA